MLKESAHEAGGFSLQERTMLTNILALRGRRVDDVMVPRADIITVQQDIPLGELGVPDPYSLSEAARV